MEENISNALLMAAAMLIFVIALTLTFSLISQTKSTADTVLYSYDDTKYYDDGYEGIIYTVASDDTKRIVDMGTIMPTVYRYIKEHYGVTIMDNDGTILARFDETTESIVNQWENYLRDAGKNTTGEESKCEKHYNYLKDIAIAAGFKEDEFKNTYGDYKALTGLWGKIYHLDKTSGNTKIEYGTPWLGDEAKIAERLDADFGGKDAQFATGTHPGLKLLEECSEKKFKEIYLYVIEDDGTSKVDETDDSVIKKNGTITDKETGDSVIIKANTSKLEIIYVMED